MPIQLVNFDHYLSACRFSHISLHQHCTSPCDILLYNLGAYTLTLFFFLLFASCTLFFHPVYRMKPEYSKNYVKDLLRSTRNVVKCGNTERGRHTNRYSLYIIIHKKNNKKRKNVTQRREKGGIGTYNNNNNSNNSNNNDDAYPAYSSNNR